MTIQGCVPGYNAIRTWSPIDSARAGGSRQRDSRSAVPARRHAGPHARRLGVQTASTTEGPAERSALARAYLEKAKVRGIELVGVTVHNDVSWIEELRDVARGLGLFLDLLLFLCLEV